MASRFVSPIRSIVSKLVAKIQGPLLPSSSAHPCPCVEDLKKLEETLEWIEAVLQDAEEREIRDKSVKLWLKHLKGVAYDAQDVLGDYLYEVLRSEVERRAAAAAGANRKRKRVEAAAEERVVRDGLLALKLYDTHVGRAVAAEATLKRKRVEEGEEDHQQQVRDLNSTSSLSTQVSIPDGMGDRIRVIRETFDKIAKHRDALSLRPEDGERRFVVSENPPQTSHLVDDTVVLGRDDEKREILELLFSDAECNPCVIPIVGMGGLGKTTLARLVYNDPKVRQHFDLRGWVCVSLVDFDVPQLTRRIIESLCKKSCDLTELSALQDTLKEEVKGKRVLVVLDDVWNEKRSPWASLRVPFLGAETAVWIIVTTRNDSVAEMMQTVSLRRLSGLPEDQCWVLFQHHAFGGQNLDTYNKDLLEIGKKIAKKCAGLPLAVKALGGLVRGEKDREKWEEVLGSDLWDLDEGEDEILPALRLSYNRLPTHLKPCFLYCSLFPKSYFFDKDNLIRLWMAQGYIQQRGSRSAEDIGSGYFDELLRRSFFQLFHGRKKKKLFHDNRMKIFVMHDLMVDLARSISREEYCTIMSKDAADKKMCNLSNEVRHLYVDNEEAYRVVTENLASYGKPTGIRTFIHTNSHGGFVPGFSSKSLGYLRVLCIRNAGLGDSIGDLKHLRYLSLDCNGTEVLQESLCPLYNLQTLELSLCDHLRELPGGIGNLVNLRYFSIQGRIKKLPESLCQFHELRTLDLSGCKDLEELPSGMGELINLRLLRIADYFYFNLNDGIGRFTVERGSRHFGGMGVLKDLVNLRGELQINWLRNVASMEDGRQANLKSKQHIQKLILNWGPVWTVDVDEELEEGVLESLQPHASLTELEINGYGGARFPSWMGDPSFSKLSRVQLSYCPNRKSLFLPALGQLPALTTLIIKDTYGVPRMWCHHQGENTSAAVAFPSLEELTFENMPQWEEWGGAQDGDFPRLRTLHIRECPKLRWLSTFPSLQSLTIRECYQLISISLHHKLGRSSLLQKVRIENCLHLTSFTGLHSAVSLENLEILYCPRLQLSPEERFPSKLRVLRFIDCWKLTSAMDLQNLIFLKSLRLERCHELIFIYLHQNPGRASMLQEVHIEDCRRPTSLVGLHSTASLENLEIFDCPQFKLLPEEGFSSKLRDLCFIDYRKLTPIMDLQILTSLKSLRLSQCKELISISLHQNPGRASMLQEVHIEDCPRLTSLVGLHSAASLENLVILKCPQLQFSPEERLPSNKLRKLYLRDCWNLTSVVMLQNPSSLEILHLERCPNLQLSPEEQLPSNKLRNLYFRDCWRLTSVVMLQNSSSLENLHLERCPNLQLLPEEPLPSKLRFLHFSDCYKLTLVLRLQNLASLKNLHLKRCPKIQILPDEWLPSRPEHVEIMDCPGLQEWCRRQNFCYLQQVPTIKELDIWDVLETTSTRLNEKPLLLEYLRNCSKWDIPVYEWVCNDLLQSFDLHQNLSKLKRLDISSCPKLTSVVGLHILASLEHLVIMDCPEIQLSQDERLPSTLRSLVVRNCDILRSLPLLHQNLSALNELHILNCCKLKSVVGLDNSTSLQTLSIKHCPDLQLSSNEQLPSMPQRVDITCCPGLREWCQRHHLPYDQSSRLWGERL